MKRHQIRRMIANVSDAQLRRAIADLGLPTGDDHNYEDEQVKQIINQFKSPNQADTGHYQQQNLGAINGAIAIRAQETANSLQALDQRLSQFEDRFADAAVDRIESVAIRIEQKIAARLQQRQEQRQKPQIVDVLDVFSVPEFDMPPAIAPSSAMGCLPM